MKNLIKIYKLLIRNIRYTLYFSILILFNLVYCQQLYSQQLSDKAGDSDIRNFKEELFVRTDRDIYITGEQVWFKVYTVERTDTYSI